jgi:hypothetical protein
MKYYAIRDCFAGKYWKKGEFFESDSGQMKPPGTPTKKVLKESEIPGNFLPEDEYYAREEKLWKIKKGDQGPVELTEKEKFV